MFVNVRLSSVWSIDLPFLFILSSLFCVCVCVYWKSIASKVKNGSRHTSYSLMPSKNLDRVSLSWNAWKGSLFGFFRPFFGVKSQLRGGEVKKGKGWKKRKTASQIFLWSLLSFQKFLGDLKSFIWHQFSYFAYYKDMFVNE